MNWIKTNGTENLPAIEPGWEKLQYSARVLIYIPEYEGTKHHCEQFGRFDYGERRWHIDRNSVFFSPDQVTHYAKITTPHKEPGAPLDYPLLYNRRWRAYAGFVYNEVEEELALGLYYVAEDGSYSSRRMLPLDKAEQIAKIMNEELNGTEAA